MDVDLSPFPAATVSAVLQACAAMSGGADESEVARAARAAIAALGPFTACTAYLLHNGLPQRCPPLGTDRPGAHTSGTDRSAGGRGLDRRIGALDGHSRRLDQPGGPWLRAIAVRHHGRCLGYLVVGARTAPSTERTRLAEVVAGQAGLALARLARRRSEHARIKDSERRRAEMSTRAAELDTTVRSLEREVGLRDALARAAASGQGEKAVLRELHEHTGLPALTEDLFGNLRAWVGPDRPADYPAADPGRREELLRQVRRATGALRDHDYLVAPVAMAGELLGLVALADPHRRAGSAGPALVQAGHVLAPLQSHERRLAELEPQLRRDLVEQLISGRATDDAFVRAAAFGHDLRPPHRIALLQWTAPPDRAALPDAVARAAGRLGLAALIGTHQQTTVVLASGLDDGEELYRAVCDDLGSEAGAVGIGGRCEAPSEFSHSYDEASRALTVRRRSHDPHGSTSFEELGLYRLMGGGDGDREADHFVRHWLGGLLDYDARHGTDLVATLSHYLESGGSYDATAEALTVHRSTVRYRLQRIHEITGHDLGNVETRLNLHVATRIHNVFDQPP